MPYVAVIVGISEAERYLDPRRTETTELKRAKKFRSEKAAEQAAQEHIGAFPKVVQRQMKYRVEPRT